MFQDSYSLQGGKIITINLDAKQQYRTKPMILTSGQHLWSFNKQMRISEPIVNSASNAAVHLQIREFHFLQM
ncbi:hypothetical protein HYFRA_00003690 [Hymenoscyphus fraxineus]|uniref:Uncharacterized protein n=1 Tax=Hymenoscyphus fraxineus TaxID=746836 RepID=A0A9N9L251_9HELO|nr:hypothetical protein HYFRA_00003690 [Hymenoscyphus fraxineus]